MKKEKEELKPIIVKNELGISKIYPKGEIDWNDPYWAFGKFLIMLVISLIIVQIILTIRG